MGLAGFLPAVRSGGEANVKSGSKRFVARVLLSLVSLVVVVSACGGDFSLAPREPVTVRFAYFGEEDFYAPMIEAFQEDNKHITIELVDWMLYRREPEMLEAFDVAVAPGNMLPGLIESEGVLVLDPLTSDDRDFSLDDYYPSAVSALSLQGQSYALPYAATTAVMFYNRDLFDKRGLAYPAHDWTWNEFLETAKQLTDEDAGEYGYAYQTPNSSNGIAEPMLLVYQHGGRLFDDLQSPTRTTLNEPLTVEAMQWYADLIHRHRVAPRPGDRATPYPLSGIEGGKYAMWLGFLEEEWDDLNVGMVALPHDQNRVTMGTVIGLCISSKAEDPQAAWKWISYISRQQPPFLMPTHRATAESDTGGRTLPAEAVEAGRASLPYMISISMDESSPLWNQYGTWIGAIQAAMGKIQNGDPVQSVLDEAQRKIDG